MPARHTNPKPMGRHAGPGRPAHRHVLIALLAFAAWGSPAALANQRALRICAALDLHAMWQIEEAGLRRAVDPQRLFSAFKTALAARAACEAGAFAEATSAYEAADLQQPLGEWGR